MTSINLGTGGTIPAQANTLTKLLIWTATQIITVQPNREFNVFSTRLPIKQADVRINPTRDFGERCSVTIVLEVNDNWKSNGLKFWQSVKPIVIDNDSTGAAQLVTIGTGGDIPATIGNLAALATWCGESLSRCNPTETARIIDTYNNLGQLLPGELVAQSIVGQVPDLGWVNLIRVAVPMDPTWKSSSLPLYQSARNISNTSLPQDLKA